MAKKAKQDATKYKDANSQILASLDIASVYEELGVTLAGKTPRKTGWLSVRAFGRDDRNPSAEINVGDGTARGRYRDFGDGEQGGSVSLWDFAADVVRKFATWQLARAEYAKRTGVELPKSEDLRPLDHFLWQKPTPSVYYWMGKNKPGIDRESIIRAGGVIGSWPARVKMEYQQRLLSFRCWGPDLFNADPVGVHCTHYHKSRIEIRNGKDVKYTKTMQKGPPGLINNWAVANWKSAKIVWVVEGLSDMLAMQKLLGDRTEEVVITMGGVSYVPDGALLELFKGKRVWICFDVDPPSEKSHSGAGQAGAAKWSAALSGVAESVRNVRLPYEGLDVKKDIRDWILEGNGYDELHMLSDKYSDMRGSEAKAEMAGLAKRGVITNAVTVDSEQGGTSTHPIAMRDIIERSRGITDNWPRRVGNQLFFHSAGKEPWYLRTSADLFAFYHQFGVNWNDRHNECVRRSELLSSLKHSATDYDAIESMPHFPEPIPRCYYTCEDIEPGDGSAMAGLMEFFRPSTTIDYHLMQAAMMTLFWNGPAGARPCFLFTTSDEAGKGGPGSGKSVTAMKISELAGGFFAVADHESAEAMKKRLLTAEAIKNRAILLDNVKSPRFSWPDLEALITTSSISGHKMYAGESSRPNYLTWMITLNGPSLSTDMAQRVITIKVDRPPSGEKGRWLKECDAYIEAHGDAVRSDIAAMFHRAPIEFSNNIRWGDWSAEVLGRLENPQVIHDEVVRRGGESDIEAEEAEDLLGEIQKRVESAGYPSDVDIWIPNNSMFKMAKDILPGHSLQSVIQRVCREITKGRLKKLKKHRFNRTRGFIYSMPDSDGENLKKDFESRCIMRF